MSLDGKVLDYFEEWFILTARVNARTRRKRTQSPLGNFANPALKARFNEICRKLVARFRGNIKRCCKMSRRFPRGSVLP
jgi:hypothetical protein